MFNSGSIPFRLREKHKLYCGGISEKWDGSKYKCARLRKIRKEDINNDISYYLKAKVLRAAKSKVLRKFRAVFVASSPSGFFF